MLRLSRTLYLPYDLQAIDIRTDKSMSLLSENTISMAVIADSFTMPFIRLRTLK